eukprot:m.129667 g.129667  ORF g.129667 m.129667 type:complete len:854 (+) comp15855_c0_seq1:75-2636(+)
MAQIEHIASHLVKVSIRNGLNQVLDRNSSDTAHENDVEHEFEGLTFHATQLSSRLEYVIGLVSDSVNNPESRAKPSYHDLQSQLFEALQNVWTSLHVLLLELPVIVRAARTHDYGLECRANGYRSLLKVLGVAVECLQGWLSELENNFASSSQLKISAQLFHEFGVKMFGTLLRLFSKAAQLAERSKDDSLFLNLVGDPFQEQILHELASDAKECFYGLYFGFYHKPGIQTLLHTIGLALVSYSHVTSYKSSSAALLASLSSGFYYWSKPDRKAKRFVEYTQAGQIGFTKKFWSLLDTTMARHWGKIIGPTLAVNQVLTIAISDEELDSAIAAEGFALIDGEDLEASTFDMLTADDDDVEGDTAAMVASVLDSMQAHSHLRGTQRPAASSSPPRSSGLATLTTRSVGQGLSEWQLVDVVDVAVRSHPAAPAAPTTPSLTSSVFRPYNAPSPQLEQRYSTTCMANDQWILQQQTSVEFDHPPEIHVRFMSYDGVASTLLNASNLSSTPRKHLSPGLVIHCHGGGFVAQSSQSHEMYLRRWTKSLRAPIVSIDYSLSPEAPYPTALQEVVYAYRWCLRNASKLGTRAERVVVVGDSAGGNLVMALALRCIAEGFRIPDAIFAMYPVLELRFSLSPSRLLAAMDPLLPEGVLRNCLQAYTGRTPELFDSTDPFLSPLLAPDELLSQLPPVHLLAAGLDPLLDDSIMMARKLRDLDRPVHIRVFDDMPHGFLCFPRTSTEVAAANDYCLDQLRTALLGVVEPTQPDATHVPNASVATTQALLEEACEETPPASSSNSGSGLRGWFQRHRTMTASRSRAQSVAKPHVAPSNDPSNQANSSGSTRQRASTFSFGRRKSS